MPRFYDLKTDSQGNNANGKISGMVDREEQKNSDRFRVAEGSSTPKSIYNNLDKDLKAILDIFKLIKEKGLDISPNLKLDEKCKTTEKYLAKWAENYKKHKSTADKECFVKKTCSDNIANIIVQKILERKREQEGNNSETPSDAEIYLLDVHDLFMFAENNIGNLLEEYIDSKINGSGWIWCKGNTIHAVDFCYFKEGENGNKNVITLLQVKNKNNTENSSSSKIRAEMKKLENTLKDTNDTSLDFSIKHWYRLSTKKESNGQITSEYHWSELTTIIKEPLNKDELASQKPDAIDLKEEESLLNQSFLNNSGSLIELNEAGFKEYVKKELDKYLDKCYPKNKEATQ